MTEVYFYREKKERDYTVLDNAFLKDAGLSWKAKGLFAYILSLPEDWKIHLSELETHATDGRDSLRTAVKELKERGYLVSEQTKNADGTFGATIFKIIERPEKAKEEKKQTAAAAGEQPAPAAEPKKAESKKPAKTAQEKQAAKKETSAADFMNEVAAKRDFYCKNGINGKTVFASTFDKAFNKALEKKKSAGDFWAGFETILSEVA